MKKKYIWIIAIIVVLAIIGIVFATNQKSDEEWLTEYTEGTDKYTGISHQYVVSPKVLSEAKEIVEIEYKIDQGMLDLEILAVGLTLYNNSKDRTIERAYVSMKVLDNNDKVIQEVTKLLGDTHGAIGPGENHDSPYLFKAYLEYLDSPSKFVITLEQVDLAESSVSSIPSPTPTAPSSLISAEESPGEVVKAFFEALKEGQYSEAEKYLSSESLTKYLEYLNRNYGKDYTSLSAAWEDNPDQIPQRVEVIEEEIMDQVEAEVTTRLYLPGGQITNDLDFDLINENSLWKLELP